MRAFRLNLERWLPCYRHGFGWLVGALGSTVLLAVAVRSSDGLGILALIVIPLLLVVWFIGLWVSSAICTWRARHDPRMALTALSAPVVALGLFVLILATVWRAWGIVPWSQDRTNDYAVARTSFSPDGKWRAIYVEDLSGGAATGTSQDVYLVRGGAPPLAFKDRVFSAECIQDLQLRWISPRVLQISYWGGDSPPVDGLVPIRPLPWFHSRRDEWKRVDPVKVVQVRRVYHGSSC